MSTAYAIPPLLEPSVTSASATCTQLEPVPTPQLARMHRERLLLAHLPQVRLVARSLWERARFAVELDDLIGYGMLGLLDAVGKFDPSRGILLKTYAEHRIRGAIIDGLRGMDWLSRSARRQAKARNAQAAATGPVSPEATAEGSRAAIAHDADLDIASSHATCEQPAAEKERKIPPQPIGMICGGGAAEIERLYQNSRIAGRNASSQPTPERLLARKQERAALSCAMEALPERQRHVLELYYRREWSMKQIAALFGVHESRISQLHLAGITKLRKALGPQISPARGASAPKRTGRKNPASLLATAV